jgi:peroxiredoxin
MKNQTHETASRPVISGPGSGRMLRSFTLLDSHGQQVRSSSYRQRQNLLLSFHHGLACPRCRAMLSALAAEAEAYRDMECAVLAIGPDDPARMRAFADEHGAAIRLLSDPDGRVVARQGLTAPALLLTDRWAEVWAAWEAGDAHAFPAQEQIADWLAFVQAQCPECTTIEWM